MYNAMQCNAMQSCVKFECWDRLCHNNNIKWNGCLSKGNMPFNFLGYLTFQHYYIRHNRVILREFHWCKVPFIYARKFLNCFYVHSTASSQVTSGKLPLVIVKVQPSLLVISTYKCSCLIEVDTNQQPATPFGRTYHNAKIRPPKLVI
jgi:hypothetical protein